MMISEVIRSPSLVPTVSPMINSLGYDGLGCGCSASNVASFVYNIVWPGLGLLGESYMLFSIGTLRPLWEYIIESNFQNEDPVITAQLLQFLNRLPYTACCGIICGMLFFGVMADRYGRRIGSISTASFMFIGAAGMTLVAAFAIDHRRSAHQFSVCWYGLILSILLFGFGVGGEYPVAAASATERSMAHGHSRSTESGKHIQLIFSMQGVGILLQVCLLTMLLLLLQLAWNASNEESSHISAGLAIVWFTLYFIGMCILCIVVVSRICHLQESSIWKAAHSQSENITTMVVEHPSSSNQISSKSEATEVLSFWPRSENRVEGEVGIQKERNVDFLTVAKIFMSSHYGLRLWAVSATWFLWDVAFYGNKLFQSTFLLALTSEVDNGNTDDSLRSLIQLSGAATINAIVALLGYVAAAYVIDLPSVGRRRLQFCGFVATGFLFLGVGFLYEYLSTTVLIVMYFGTSFFGQCGPNATTFILPAEAFPTELRTICHGIAAACGKLGALAATIVFHKVSNRLDLFLISGYASCIAAIVTYWFIPETAGHDLSENDEHWNYVVSSFLSSESRHPHSQQSHDDYHFRLNPVFLSAYERRRRLQKLDGSSGFSANKALLSREM